MEYSEDARVEVNFCNYPNIIKDSMGMFPKIGGFPPKWMVKIMENSVKMDDLGFTIILGNIHVEYINDSIFYSTAISCPLKNTTQRLLTPYNPMFSPFSYIFRCYVMLVSGRVYISPDSTVMAWLD